MLSIFGVTLVLYFVKILSDSKKMSYHLLRQFLGVIPVPPSLNKYPEHNTPSKFET
jgi:hypothetical protein